MTPTTKHTGALSRPVAGVIRYTQQELCDDVYRKSKLSEDNVTEMINIHCVYVAHLKYLHKLYTVVLVQCTTHVKYIYNCYKAKLNSKRSISLSSPAQFNHLITTIKWRIPKKKKISIKKMLEYLIQKNLLTYTWKSRLEKYISHKSKRCTYNLSGFDLLSRARIYRRIWSSPTYIKAL